MRPTFLLTEACFTACIGTGHVVSSIRVDHVLDGVSNLGLRDCTMNENYGAAYNGWIRAKHATSDRSCIAILSYVWQSYVLKSNIASSA